MTPSFLQSSFFLFLGIAVIVLLTAKFRVHAFFALLLASFITGLGVQMPAAEIITTIEDGFGRIMRSLALIILLGTTLGVLLEHTGSTRVMASAILKRTGQRNAALAMSLTGFIVGMPIFCDSGYIVLNGLNKSLAKRTGISIAVMSVSLATGLLSVHCLIPPHPGATAAAGVIGVDIGQLIMYGILAAIPAMLIGFWWATHAGKTTPPITIDEEIFPAAQGHPPSTIKAFLPVIVPIMLIAVRSFLVIGSQDSGWLKIFSLAGDPVIALSIGILLAFASIPNWKKNTVSKLLSEGAEKAGGILIIIGAGGAFGAVLAATKIGDHFSQAVSLGSLGLLFPFLLTSVLKTAQGSSTVAIITAASIIQPLLHPLGLDSEHGKLICVLSMGAGSMMISHSNDAYFWVISKFSGLDIRTMLKVYSIATLLMGLTTLLMVYILSLLLL